MKLIFIITFIFFSLGIFYGCSPETDVDQEIDPAETQIISDQYGFRINDLAGFTEDKVRPHAAWNILTLRKPGVRVQFGYIRNLRYISDIPGIPSPTLENLLSDWVYGMLDTPRFYPGTDRTVLNTKYSEIDGYLTLITDLLLEFDSELLEDLDKTIVDISEEEFEFFENHPRALLRTYHFFRDRDLVHIEIFSDPLTFQAEISDFEKTLLQSIKFRPLPTQ